MAVIGEFEIGLIASERRSHFTNNAVEDPRVSDPEWAKREGMVSFAGNPLIVEDRLVGVMAMFARLAKFRRGIEYCETDIKRIARTLEAQSLDPTRLQILLKRTPPSQRAFVESMLGKLKKVVAARSDQQAKFERLEGEAIHSYSASLIEISQQVFAGVQVRFGERDQTVDEGLEAVSFYWTSQGIMWKAIEE
jgi:uncharacterized protein (DUF342 family)